MHTAAAEELAGTFLDVDDLVTGGGTKEVDHSRCVLIFAMPVYFEKIDCVKEMTRTIVRQKPEAD